MGETSVRRRAAYAVVPAVALLLGAGLAAHGPADPGGDPVVQSTAYDPDWNNTISTVSPPEG